MGNIAKFVAHYGYLILETVDMLAIVDKFVYIYF